MGILIWQCTSCRHDLVGNPVRCPHCGSTVYKATFKPGRYPKIKDSE